MAKQQNNGQEQDVNQLRKVRRDKLAELQQNGKDPFKITKFDQTHHSLEVKSLYEAHEAELLKDHHTPDVEGMDEEQAKEVLKKDYEERRSIMDANPIHVAIAGRMMFKRVMGKASFCNIQDLQGNIQVYVARDAIGTDSYADFKKSDIGDIFGQARRHARRPDPLLLHGADPHRVPTPDAHRPDRHAVVRLTRPEAGFQNGPAGTKTTSWKIPEYAFSF